jgi:hypothetical protein
MVEAMYQYWYIVKCVLVTNSSRWFLTLDAESGRQIRRIADVLSGKSQTGRHRGTRRRAQDISIL